VAWTAAILLSMMGSVPAVAQRPLNLDFETASVADSTMPWGWALGWSAFSGGASGTFVLDDQVRHHGDRSLRIAVADSAAGAAVQNLTLQVPADFARGRTLRLRAWTRAQSVRGRALVTLEAWRNLAVAAADTAQHTESGAGWQRHELRITVPNDPAIHSIVMIAALEGTGTAWFDDLSLERDGDDLTALPAAASSPSASNLRWLADYATPLRTVDPGDDADDSDLRPFDSIVGNAQIIGLGESTHGTREFFQAKHRLVEHLVRRHGFRMFAVEANQLSVERINRFVQTGEGEAQRVIRAMFAVWNTEEMLALINWVRAWNVAHPDKMVRFVGYDMQDHKLPADSLRAFLGRVEPALLPRLDHASSEYRAQTSFATPVVPDTTRARWQQQLEDLWRDVSGRRTAWLARAVTRTDSLQVEWTIQSANLLRQAARLNSTLNSPDRDSLMAANLDWALHTLAPARTVVWAHDVHVSRGGDRERSFNGGAQMGAYLARTHPGAYRAVSLLTYDGAYGATRSFRDYTRIDAAAFPGPPGSLEAALHALKRPGAGVGWIVDLQAARAGSDGAWLRVPRPIRHIGYAAYDYGFELQAIAPLEFDGIVFIDHTTPSRPLR